MKTINDHHSIYEAEAVDIQLAACFDNRYEYDLHLKGEDGWLSYDTPLDRHWYGVWVNIVSYQIFTFSYGDKRLVQYHGVQSFKEALGELAEDHGITVPSQSRNCSGFWFDRQPDENNLEFLIAEYRLFYRITKT